MIRIRYLLPDDRIIVRGKNIKYEFTAINREGMVHDCDIPILLGMVKRHGLCCGGGKVELPVFEQIFSENLKFEIIPENND